MPIYDYECRSCSARFEAFHPIGAPAPGCPRCNGAARKLVLAAPVIHGEMARGRERAVSSLPVCGKGCSCCPPE
ncbi:MAG: hypothetical protein B7X93_05345 [Hydrogenophilales bacterium 17-61-9]|nr:MAG: hypothetical protein B7X93_05345 [Hydrogenophilales bacterium 17-61-9]